MFSTMDDKPHRFDDFRANGLLLPCNERAAVRMALPLHRGPHRHYSGLVIERVGQVEAAWSRLRLRNAESAVLQAQMRLDLLQRALRRFLLDSRRRRLVLNRHDPLRAGIDFSDLDAAADALWGATRGATWGATGRAVQSMPRRPRSSSLAA